MAERRMVIGSSVAERGSLAARRRGLKGDALFRAAASFFALLVLVVAAVVIITTFASAHESIARYGFGFITTRTWDPSFKKIFGAQSFIFGTAVSSIIALMLAGVVGIGIALLLVELRLPRWFTVPIAFLVELLAAIPSIVFGAWGFLVLIPFMQAHVDPFLFNSLGWIPLFGRDTAGGASLLTAGLILAIMIVPTVAAISRDVVRVVPASQREAALALGATRWEMIRISVLPYARAGIIGGLILALGRAVGETIAATMVIGNQIYIGPNLLAGADTLASRIANNFGEASDPLYKSALFELGLILFLVSLGLNALARLLVWSVSRGSAQVT